MLVYPPDNYETNSETIFFIGSARERCFINGVKVDLYPTGNFCPVFKLEIGENRFEIEIDGERIVRVVTRIKPVILSPEQTEGREDLSEIRIGSLRSPLRDSLRMTKININSKICLDPGHGGSQCGTCSPKGLAEKDVNLALAKKIQSKLLADNYQVIMTREEDKDLALAERVNICKKNNCELFISVHHNAIPDNQNPIEHQGISVHYYYENSKNIAEIFLEHLCKQTGLNSAGVIWQDLHVLRENPETPCILIEFGYLIHPIESEIIVSEEFQEKCAEAISSVILSLA